MKTLFLDCDGTLTNYEEVLPDSAKLACELASKKGNKLVLCTGRSKVTILDSCLNLPIDGIIAANGGYIEYKNQCILKSPVDDNVSKQIISGFLETQRPFFLETDYGTYGPKYYYEWLANEFEDLDRDVPEITKSFTKRLELIDDVLNVTDINKFTFVLKNRNDVNDYMEKYPFLNTHLMFPSIADSRYCETVIKGIDKGFGIREFQKLTNTVKEDCMAFGDWDNDVIMFPECKESIAMGNGSDFTKSKATYVTDDVYNDGLYKAFKHFDLI